MARPISPFAGSAPGIMSSYGQGMQESGQYGGNMAYKGYSELGAGIGKAVKGAASALMGAAGMPVPGMGEGGGILGAIGESYGTAKSTNKIAQAFLSDPNLSQQYLGLNDEQRKQQLSSLNQFIDANGQISGSQLSSQLIGNAMKRAQFQNEQATKAFNEAQQIAQRGLVGAITSGGGASAGMSYLPSLPESGTSYAAPEYNVEVQGPIERGLNQSQEQLIPGVKPQSSWLKYVPKIEPSLPLILPR